MCSTFPSRTKGRVTETVSGETVRLAEAGVLSRISGRVARIAVFSWRRRRLRRWARRRWLEQGASTPAFA